MTVIKCAIATIVLGILLPLSAEASLLSVDYSVSGDGLFTLDTNTGLRWLDVSQTRGLSASSIIAGSGGWTDSFRYATTSELAILFADAGLSNSATYNTAEYTAALTFNSLFNTANNSCNTNFACAFTVDDRNPGYINLINVGTLNGQGFSYTWIDYSATTFTNSAYGSLLVEKTPVPEPPAVALLLVALGVLPFAVRRLQSSPEN